MSKGMKFLNLFVLGYLVWLMLTSSLAPQELIAGLIVAALAALVGVAFIPDFPNVLSPMRWVWFLVYVPVFLWELIKANVHMAYLVLHPRLPIKPAILRVPVPLKRDISKVVVANSITLTPGTLSVDVRDDSVYVHCVDPSEEELSNPALVAEKFVKHARRFSE